MKKTFIRPGGPKVPLPQSTTRPRKRQPRSLGLGNSSSSGEAAALFYPHDNKFLTAFLLPTKNCAQFFSSRHVFLLPLHGHADQPEDRFAASRRRRQASPPARVERGIEGEREGGWEEVICGLTESGCWRLRWSVRRGCWTSL